MITLDIDPFSLEYWSRLKPLPTAIRALMNCSTAPYVAYWLDRAKSDDRDKALNMAMARLRLIESIRDEGYDPDRWMASERDYRHGQGPITVNIGADGTIWSWDGSHRACILRELGLPVEAKVLQRSERWEQLRKQNYQPYPHPDFADHKPLRSNVGRIATIGQDVKGASVAVVGACMGFESMLLADAGKRPVAIESNPDRFALCHALGQRVGFESVNNRADDWDYSGYDAVLGLSVYHHVATSERAWLAVVDRLAKCPRHYVELPADHDRRWHDQFRAECGGRCQSGILGPLIEAGKYNPPRIVYVDREYEGRVTVVLERNG